MLVTEQSKLKMSALTDGFSSLFAQLASFAVPSALLKRQSERIARSLQVRQQRVRRGFVPVCAVAQNYRQICLHSLEQHPRFRDRFV
jgi:hypothetical protein